MKNSLRRLQKLTGKIINSYEKHGGINRLDREDLPVRENVYRILDDMFMLLFPGYYGDQHLTRDKIEFFVNGMVDALYVRLKDEVFRALVSEYRERGERCSGCDKESRQITADVLDMIPEIREKLKKDVQAAYEGDPAAKKTDEVISCYPCIEAIATYRIAHQLYLRDVPLIPRMMTERAHHRTGIDIHPGAVIGEYFFIDHGTGVVIGETATIHDNVKIYQGVTLGALSFPKDKNGNIMKGGQRHPTIESDVVIYSGATILGGDTVIGEGSVIGGNTWIITSIPPGTQVTVTARQELKTNKSHK